MDQYLKTLHCSDCEEADAFRIVRDEENILYLICMKCKLMTELADEIGHEYLIISLKKLLNNRKSKIN